MNTLLDMFTRIQDMITLQEINLILGMISTVLLISSEILSKRYRTIEIRISKERLRKASYVSSIAFILTLIILMALPFLPS